MLINESDIKQVDISGMYNLIKSFPDQASEAVKIAKAAKVKLSVPKIKNIVITGLGGSAIGGDILRSYSADQAVVPILVNRSYTLPEFVGGNSLVVVSSYSGGTEETISAYAQARKKGAQILVVSSGGRIGETASKMDHNWIKIPGGLPPRAALGYSFFSLLTAFQKVGLLKSKPAEIKETLTMLKQLSEEYSDYQRNPQPLRLADQLMNMLPILYSSTERFDAVNLRWRGQMEENAKTVAYGNFFPEMNHNEIVGYSTLKDLLSRFLVIYLLDEGDHPRVSARFGFVKEIIRPYCSNVIEIHSQGKSLLARMFSLIHLGDWTSYYLAVGKNVDPTPVSNIDMLKKNLSELR
jgi:glucose/mannose-6-phosphate isomerase